MRKWQEFVSRRVANSLTPVAFRECLPNTIFLKIFNTQTFTLAGYENIMLCNLIEGNHADHCISMNVREIDMVARGEVPIEERDLVRLMKRAS